MSARRSKRKAEPEADATATAAAAAPAEPAPVKKQRAAKVKTEGAAAAAGGDDKKKPAPKKAGKVSTSARAVTMRRAKDCAEKDTAVLNPSSVTEWESWLAATTASSTTAKSVVPVHDGVWVAIQYDGDDDTKLDKKSAAKSEKLQSGTLPFQAMLESAIVHGWKPAPPTTIAKFGTGRGGFARSIRIVPRMLTLGLWSPPERTALYEVMRSKRIVPCGTRVACSVLSKIFEKEIAAGHATSPHLNKSGNKPCK